MSTDTGGGDSSAAPRRRRPVTAEERLIHDLFIDYDTDARSVVRTASTVVVSIQFLLLQINRLVRTQLLVLLKFLRCQKSVIFGRFLADFVALTAARSIDSVT